MAALCLLLLQRLQSLSKEAVPAPGASGRLFPGKGWGWSRSWPGQALSPTPGTERSNPGMQHNLEDGMERGRSGLRQVPGADSRIPPGPGGLLECGTESPAPGRGHGTFLSISLAAQRLQPSPSVLSHIWTKSVCQLATHRTHQHFPAVEVYSRTIPGME